MANWFTRLFGGRKAREYADQARARGNDPPIPRADSKVIPQLPLYLQVLRIGGSITPQQVSDIIRQADTGYMWQLVDLGNESKQRDTHLQSNLQTRELALAGLPWQISAPIPPKAKKPRLKDRKAAEFCTERLKAIEEFPRLVSHLVGANFYGYAVSEILWAKDGRYVVPVGFDHISARRFVFDIADGVLKWCDINAGQRYPGVNLREEYPDSFIQYQPRVTGDVPCREGLIRVLMWCALFRNWDLRDWLALAELAWKPWRTASFEKGSTSQEDINAVVAILDNMAATGVAVHPKNVEVNVEWPKNSVNGNSAHKVLFDTMGAEMSKCILGQTLTTEQGSRGSQSLGKVHDNVRKDLREGDAKSVSAVIRRDLLTPMVRKNFGPDVAVPEFAFLTEDPTDLKAFSEAIKNFRGAGLEIPAKWVRDEAGMPEPAEGEELLGEAQEEELEEQAAGAAGANGKPSDENPDDPPSKTGPAGKVDDEDDGD